LLLSNCLNEKISFLVSVRRRDEGNIWSCGLKSVSTQHQSLHRLLLLKYASGKVITHVSNNYAELVLAHKCLISAAWLAW